MGCVLGTGAPAGEAGTRRNGENGRRRMGGRPRRSSREIRVEREGERKERSVEVPAPDVGRRKSSTVLAYTLKNYTATNEQGWPTWLVAVAGDAIKDWTPRRASTFEKLDKAMTIRILVCINAFVCYRIM